MVHGPKSSLVHAVFSTKDSCSTIPGYLIERLWSFCGTVAKENEMKALAIGGSNNHMHILLSLPETVDPPSALRLMKCATADFLNQRMSGDFEWQEGYGAFTVQLPSVTEYPIKSRFLAKNGIVLDSKRCLKSN